MTRQDRRLDYSFQLLPVADKKTIHMFIYAAKDYHVSNGILTSNMDFGSGMSFPLNTDT